VWELFKDLGLKMLYRCEFCNCDLMYDKEMDCVKCPICGIVVEVGIVNGEK